ncbi:YesU family protein [Paenibacillus soyae]|uniref:YesU family protein n=1 Tax=Paenibacillus soyae TaxID=2969249 RepID=A0A9X2S9Y4_9BACL|nr:YesU family protein [Paenibacillus soyae]MCR2805641.1 YesU family protein [Paenibacillus soyae]
MGIAEEIELGELLYANPLRHEADARAFVMEGDGAASFPLGRMRLESIRDPKEGQAANIVYWCKETFPDDIAIRFNFWPIRQPGLCILFFSAAGRGGEDLFDPALLPRNGIYDQYHHGDINAYHISYFRKSYASERRFQTCNLRKSYGFHLTAQGADPIPSIADCDPPYRIQVVKSGPVIRFSIDGLPLFQYMDDGETYGPVLGGGKIGFRQMAPMIAEYSELEVYSLKSLQGR